MKGVELQMLFILPLFLYFTLSLPHPSSLRHTSSQGSRDISQCDHEIRLLCIDKELIQPRENAVRYSHLQCPCLCESNVNGRRFSSSMI